MAKSKVSAGEMAARLMGSGAAPSAQAPQASQLPAPVYPVASEAGKAQQDHMSAQDGTKRLNLNISIQQWHKLKNHAMDRNMSVSDVIRDCINNL